jgi:predicted transcriptional regulator
LVRDLRARRLHLGLTQRQVAAKCGVSQSCITDWESGTKTPTLHHLQCWVNALNMALALRDLEEEW